jgi:butyrate kinase
MYQILAINPGSTSTKLALFEDEKCLWTKSVQYNKDQLQPFKKVTDQLDMRTSDIQAILNEMAWDPSHCSAVVGRGGPFKRLDSGTYAVDDTLLEDIKAGRVQAEHISNLGPVIAHTFAAPNHIPAFFVDPVSVDEFEPVARISGLPEIERKSLLHALNIKATAHKAARAMNRPLTELNLIVAHLGGGISICPVHKGRIIDVNNANESGPFSPERAGSLPVSSLAKLCYSGKYDYDEMKRRIVGEGGLTAWLGTNDSREVEEMIDSGDEKAELIYKAMAYQIAKEIGAMATVLSGTVDAVLITGGLANSERLVTWVEQRVAFIAPLMVFPGENELEALAMGSLRVLRGEENAKTY